jgi:hypothetical protein
MIEGLPLYVPVVFLLTTLATIWFLLAAAKAVSRDLLSYKLLIFLLPFWLLLTGFLATTPFYRDAEAMPPRVFLYGVWPAVALIIAYFVFFRVTFVERLSLKHLTLLHTVRFPVELVLLWLFQAGQVPQLMTFEGWNFDILSGITAPIVYFLAFKGGRTNRTLLIVWNVIALGLLANIVTLAVLSFQGPLQRVAFDQPNVGVTFLPFIWLPAIIVPIVLFAHLASLWQLIFRRNG